MALAGSPESRIPGSWPSRHFRSNPFLQQRQLAKRNSLIEATSKELERLDGIYIVRTGEPVEDMSAEDAVRNYKRLTQVERTFRSMKGLDLLVNPIFLSREDHVTAHIFLCMLAYYLEWHLREALAPVLFADEELGRSLCRM